MNAYRFNGKIGHHARQAIVDSLHISHHEIYKEVIDILHDGTICTKNGKVYKLTLTEIKNEQGYKSV